MQSFGFQIKPCNSERPYPEIGKVLESKFNKFLNFTRFFGK